MAHEHAPIVEAISLLSTAAKQAPSLEGVPTGVEGLDDLFFTVEWKDGVPRKRSLGGIPRYAVMQVTGVADTGKSLMVEQFAIKQAQRGTPCVFVTAESPAPFVTMGLRRAPRQWAQISSILKSGSFLLMPPRIPS